MYILYPLPASILDYRAGNHAMLYYCNLFCFYGFELGLFCTILFYHLGLNTITAVLNL